MARWPPLDGDSVGLVRFRIEREGWDDPIRFGADWARAAQGSSTFSPLALFDARQPRALHGLAFEPRSVDAHVE